MLFRIGACLVAGALFVGLGDAMAAQDEEKEAAMEEIQALMEAGNWKKAIKEIKSYERKHAESDSEKEEVSRLLSLAEGHQEFEKIQSGYQKKQKARKATKDLREFLEEYAGFPELKEKGEELLETVRSAYVLVIEDFEEESGEGEVVEEGERSRWDRTSLVTDPKFVKHGEASCRWRTGVGWDWWGIDSPKLDWSQYDYFCMWIFNEKLGKRPARIEIEPHSGGWHYFQYYLAIDWVGWREIRVPLEGRASKFGRHGNPQWSTIEYLDFDHDDDVGTPLDIIIDDIRLEKHVK